MSEKPDWCPENVWGVANEVTGQVDDAIWHSDMDCGLNWGEAQPAIARAILAAQEPYRTAVLTIIKAVQSYLPPDSGVSEKDFISEVIGAVDNPEVYAALHGTSDAGNDSLKRALERGR